MLILPAGLLAGPVGIYLTVTAAAASLTILVARVSAQLLHTDPGHA
jgi:hypothetical protein